MTAQPHRLDRAELHAWLTERVARYLRRPAEEIDPTRPLPEYGLDSVYALAVCGDIEDYLGIQLESTALWEHPTIEQLAAYLERTCVRNTGTSAR